MRPSNVNLSELPHWHRPHAGELRWPVTFVVTVVIVLQYLLPKSLSLKSQPEICILEGLLALALFLISPGRISKHRRSTWWTGIALILCAICILCELVVFLDALIRLLVLLKQQLG